MMKPSPVITSLLLVLLLSVVAATVSICKLPPLLETEGCVYGVTQDFCGRKVCAKGPGERCGGTSNILGKCTEGTHCKCNRCVGCSLNPLQCARSSNYCLY